MSCRTGATVEVSSLVIQQHLQLVLRSKPTLFTVRLIRPRPMREPRRAPEPLRNGHSRDRCAALKILGICRRWRQTAKQENQEGSKISKIKIAHRSYGF